MMSKNVILMIFIVIILFLVYENKKEHFQNNVMPLNYNYNNLTSNSNPPWVIKQKKLTQIEDVLYKIAKMINKETKKNYFIGNIDNITINDIDDNNQHYIIDLFLFEKDEDYTLKIVIDFTITNKKYSKTPGTIMINTITRSNAMKYNYNYLDINQKIEQTPLLLLDKLDKPIIKGFNEIELPYSLYDGEHKTLTSTIKSEDYYQEFTPLLVEKDIHYLKEKENVKLKVNNDCSKNKRCWDNNGILNRDPKYFSCSSLNNFKREPIPLQPTFNSSLIKNISDKKENSWLFKPTRVEIDHNF